MPAWSSAEAEFGSVHDAKNIRDSAYTAHAGYVKVSDFVPESTKRSATEAAKIKVEGVGASRNREQANQPNSKNDNKVDPSTQSAYDKVISENLTSIGKYLADQSSSFGAAAEAADGRGSSKAGEGTPSASPGRNVAKWALENGKLVSPDFLEELPILSESTSEHVVYLRDDGRVVKRTKELYYGQVPAAEGGALISKSASPAEYLRRMALQTAVFHSDLRLEGFTIPKESLFFDDPSEAPYIVISQPWLKSEGVVTNKAIEELLSKEGFTPVPDSFFGWVRKADGVVVLDASP